MSVSYALLLMLTVGLLGSHSFVAVHENNEVPEPDRDTCTYELRSVKVTKRNQENYRPFDDVEIVRRSNCARHMLNFPARGTANSYYVIDTVTADTVYRANFSYSREGRLWDITYVRGTFRVRMSSCHMGGEFMLKIR